MRGAPSAVSRTRPLGSHWVSPMLHNRRGSRDGGVDLPRRGSLRAGGMMAAATASPWAAQAAEAGSGTGSLLLAVGVGAAVALAAVAVVLRSRDRGPPTAAPALAAACAFWWRTDPSGRIVEIEPGRLAAGVSTEPLRGRLLWDPFDDGSTLEALEAAFRDGRSFTSVPCPGSAAFGRRSRCRRPAALAVGRPARLHRHRAAGPWSRSRRRPT